MRGCTRSLVLTVAISHLAVAAVPCLGAPRRAHEHHGDAVGSVAADPAAHCAEHAERPPFDATAPCPCGCGEAAAPGGIGGRLGFAVLPAAPQPPPSAWLRNVFDDLPRLPGAPPRVLDPVPI